MTACLAFITLLLQTTTVVEPASISGVVVNGATGEPLPGVRVELARTDMPLGGFAQLLRGAPRGVTLPVEALSALRSAAEAESLDARSPQESPPQLAALKALPLDDLLEVIVSPGGEPAVVSRLSPPITTDERGRFAFSDVRPGAFRLIFSANGYVRQDYGQRTPEGSGVAITLSPGQRRPDVIVKMSPTGAVSGRIRDASGQPAAGVPVQLLRFSYDESGKKQPRRVAATVTDDRGEYRMFYLTAGRYYLSAGSQTGQTRNVNEPLLGVGNLSPNAGRQRYGLTYFPGVTESGAARAIDVQAGADVQGIDMFVDAPQLFRVRGRVIDPGSGRPAPSITVSANLQTDDLLESLGSRDGTYKASDGTFEINGVSPGAYSITASTWNSMDSATGAGLSTMSPADRTIYFESSTRAARSAPRGSASLTIVNADVDGVVLTLSRSLSIPGRIRIESNDSSVSVDPRLLLIQLTAPGRSGRVFSMNDDPESQRATADGIFRIENVLPGEYRMSVRGLPPGFYIKDARLGATDILNGRVVVPDSGNDTLEILLSANVGMISGETLDAAGQPVPGAQVVLIPAQNRERFELFRPVSADSGGHFTISSVAPGDYMLAAWDAIDPYAFFDPQLLEQAERSGKAVRVEELSRQAVIVEVIPAGK